MYHMRYCISRLTALLICAFSLSASGSLSAQEPEIELRNSSNVEITSNGTADFGSGDQEGVITRTFEIKNTGTANLTGISVTVPAGAPLQDFYVTAQPSRTVLPGSSTTFQVRFYPRQGGACLTTFEITSNDSDENPFYLTTTGTATMPEIQVEEPVGTQVYSSIFNPLFDREFGTVNVGSSNSLTFTVKNTGAAPLLNLLPTLSGPYPGDYQITTNPASSLAPGASTTFTVAFQPTREGERQARINIASNDFDENPFNIELTGIGQAADLEVRDPAGTEMNYLGLKRLNFQSVRVGASKSLTFTVKNAGLAPMTGLGLTKGGDFPDEFMITQGAGVTELAVGASTAYTVTFSPTATGSRTATLSISSNDPDENPFTITLGGSGSIPEIVVEYGGANVPQGSTTHLGNVNAGGSLQKSFIIKTTGIGPLHVVDTTLEGSDSAGLKFYYRLTDEWAAPGQDLALQILFAPTTYGTRTATVKIFNDDEDEGVYEFTVTATGMLPGIQVEEPVGTPLVTPASREFGPAGVNALGQSLTFTIKNPGTLPLSLSPLLSGANAADFTMTTPPAFTVQPGASTTMTVRFSPKATGVRRAGIGLTHNANIQQIGSFTISLRGTGVYTEVSLASETFVALHGDPHAQVTLKRTETSIPATVELQTLAGTASSIPPVKSAQPGEDFTALTAPAAVVTFSVGEAEKTVDIPLLAPALGAAENRQFLVKLVNAGAGVTIEQPNEALVRIVGADSAKPTLTLTTPAAGKISTTWPLVVSGKAGDPKGIDRVEVKVGEAEPVLATLSHAATKPTDVPFTCDLTPPDGTHTLVVTAYDLRGNSTSVTRTITFSRRYQLLLRKLTGDMSGSLLSTTIAMTATPAASATALVTNPQASWEQTSAVAPGTKIKLVATVKKGFVFGRWDVQERTPSVSLGNEVTFTMPSEDVVAAALVDSGAFVPEVTSQTTSTMHWLLSPPETEGTEPAFGSQAYLTGKMTPTGGLTGKLLIGGQSIPVVATCYADTPAVFTVAGKKRDSLPVPGGVLTLTNHSRRVDSLNAAHIMATLKTENGEVLSTVRGEPAMSKADATLLNSVTKGTYTMRLTAVPAATLPMAPMTYPQSSGYATMTLSKTGAISLAGMLADGTAVTMSTGLLSYGKAPLYIQLPTPGGKTKLGLVTGHLEFFSTHPDQDLTARLHWYRPAAASPNVLLYPAGWPAGLTLEVEGAPYAPGMTAQSALFGITLKEPSPARLYFTGGKLTAPIEKSYLGIIGNTVVKLAPVDNSYTLKIVPATGLFSGTFTPNWSNPSSAKPTFKGVILQKGPATATGFFINNAKGETAPESGSVTLGAPAQ